MAAKQSIKTKWRHLPALLRGGIIGAVLFLIIWNLAFIMAYIFVLYGLWDVLFYISYPALQPVVKALNFLFGNCYSASKCFARIPFSFVTASIIQGFILGAIVEWFRQLISDVSQKTRKK